MMNESKHIPIEHEFDPERCQSNSRAGQCTLKRVPGREYCPKHIGCGASAGRKVALNAYKLQVWNERISELAEHEGIKTLRDEVAIARMTLEGILSQCKDQADLLLYSNKISDMVMKIEKLVNTCQRLDVSHGTLLDKSAVVKLCNFVIGVIGESVEDPEVIEQVATKIMDFVGTLKITKDE